MTACFSFCMRPGTAFLFIQRKVVLRSGIFVYIVCLYILVIQRFVCWLRFFKGFRFEAPPYSDFKNVLLQEGYCNQCI